MDLLARLARLKEELQKLRELKQWKELGLEKERGALAMLAMSFFGILYFLVAMNGPDGWGRVFAGLSLCYLTGFLGLASQWFWARWYATGLGWSGFTVGLMVLVLNGWHPAIFIYTAFHGLVIAGLMGQKMAARYELQPGWKEKYGLDEFGVTRLGKAVTRGSASLPTLIMWALAPREGQGLELLPTAIFLLGALAVAALLRLKTWGLLALGGVAALVLALVAFAPGAAVATAGLALPLPGSWPLVTAGWSLLAVAPFLSPAWRFLRAETR